MSSMAPETAPAAAAPSRGAGGGNVLTRKIGPLPTWAWVAIAAAALLGWAYYKNRTSSSSTGSGATTDASQVPQFVNQTFTTVTPPTAPNPVPGPAPAPVPAPTPAWHDEGKKDKKIRAWEHKHPGQEYPFSKWQGNPTAAQLAAFNAAHPKPPNPGGPIIMPPVAASG